MPRQQGYGWGGYGPAGIGYGPGQFGFGSVPEAWPTPALDENLVPTAGFLRRVTARAVDLALAFLLLLIPFAMIDNSRPFAHVFIGIVGMAAYEAMFLTWTGATPGKLLMGIRVAELNLTGPVSPPAAIRRGLRMSVMFPIGFVAGLDELADGLSWGVGLLLLVPSAVIMLASAATSPLLRTFLDRATNTVVVSRTAPALITTEDLDRWTNIAAPAEPTPYGPVATLAQRRRARTERLEDAPLLVLALAACALLTTVAASSGWRALMLAWSLWLVAFVADETWRISRYGATAGHRRAGLAVVDIATGEPPSPRRSFLRALVLGLIVYTVVLLPVLLLWTRVARFRRGPHDRIARTVVVAVTAPVAKEVAGGPPS